MAAPTLLIIGHLCHDRLPSGEIKLGGTAAYAALLAKKMGAEVTILTSVGSDFSFWELFKKQEIGIINIPSKETTIFENIYPEAGERIQYLHGRAATIAAEHIPDGIATPDLVLFGPIADEVSFELLECYPDALKAATIQGWLRGWKEDGQVFSKGLEWENLGALDLLIFSDADVVGFEDVIPGLAGFIPIVIMTRGENGVRVFQKNAVVDYPTIPVDVKDSTGAGDSFAMAFLLRYYETKDLVGSVEYGQEVARKLLRSLS